MNPFRWLFPKSNESMNFSGERQLQHENEALRRKIDSMALTIAAEKEQAREAYAARCTMADEREAELKIAIGLALEAGSTDEAVARARNFIVQCRSHLTRIADSKNWREVMLLADEDHNTSRFARSVSMWINHDMDDMRHPVTLAEWILKELPKEDESGWW